MYDISFPMENKIIAQNDMNNAFDAAIFGNYAIFTGEEEFLFLIYPILTLRKVSLNKKSKIPNGNLFLILLG
ncbi:hypothetical protein LEP1GSC170_5844 [Leptospira interrogans serovar Bataviae str. HAI135]|nr:hypothetical protein LEP1GSC170_5844 [Leptospira interrogans serovar Bataviae str. HAI135]